MNLTGRLQMLTFLSGLTYGLLSPTVVAPAAAQEVTSSLSQLQGVVAPGDLVSVTDDTGHKTQGRVESISADAIQLAVPAPQTVGGKPGMVSFRHVSFTDTQVTMARRQVPDSVLNGGIVGAVVAGGPGFLGLLWITGGTDDAGEVARQYVPAFAAIGFAVGVAIDAMTSRWLTVYESSATNGPTASMSPLISKAGAGAKMSLRF